MSLPEVQLGENGWSVVDLSQLVLFPDTSFLAGRLVSNALDPTLIGFVTPFDLPRDKQWDIYVEVEWDKDPDFGATISLSSGNYDTVDTGTELLYIGGPIATEGSEFLWSTIGEGASGSAEWVNASTLNPPQNALTVKSGSPITMFAYREYIDTGGGIEEPNPNEYVSVTENVFVPTGFGTKFYVSETAEWRIITDRPDEGPMVLAGILGEPLDPAKFYDLRLQVYAPNPSTTDFEATGGASDADYTSRSIALADQFEGPSTGGNFTVVAHVGPGMSGWDIATGQNGQHYASFTLNSSAPYAYAGMAVNNVEIRETPVVVPEIPWEHVDGSYADVITATDPDLSWELDDTTTVPDSSGNERDGTYTGTIRQAESLMVDESGSSVILGEPGETAIGITREGNADLEVTSFTIQMSVQFSDVGPVAYPSGAVTDIAQLAYMQGALIMQYTYSGDIYAQYYGPTNTRMLIAQVGAGSALIANVSANEKHLITLTYDNNPSGDQAYATLYVDGVKTPDYPLTDGFSFPNPVASSQISGPWSSVPAIGLGNINPVLDPDNENAGHGTIFDSFHIWKRKMSQAEVENLYEAWSTPYSGGGGPAEVEHHGAATSGASAEIELSNVTIIALEDLKGRAGSSVAVEPQLLVAQYLTTRGTGRAGSTVAMPRRSATRLQTPIRIGARVSGSYVDLPSDMSMTILDDVVDRTPSSIPVVISGAIPGSQLKFYFNNETTLRYQVQADSMGSLAATSIPLPPLVAGGYVLRVESGSRVASDTFSILYAPTTLKTVTVDADPVEVPGALRSDGSRSWVLQDLFPNGLGSYIFKRNPSNVDSRPINGRSLTGRHSTAPGGKHHIFEALSNAFEWTFEGVAFTQDDQEKLYAYLDLNRRFYLIDQRNRAWIVSFTGIDMVPRLRKNLAIKGEAQTQLTDWMADYTVTAVTHDPAWRTPIPLP